MNKETIYKCDKCGTTSTNPADALLKFFCMGCLGAKK